MIEPKPCIYMLKNVVNGKIYIGKSKNALRRFTQYKSAFKKPRSKYLNSHISRSIKKYGTSNFTFSVIEYVSEAELADREIHWMKHFRSHERDFGYNLRVDSSGKTEFTPDMRMNLSLGARNQWLDKSKREKTIEGLKRGWNDLDRKREHRERCRRQFRRNSYWVFRSDGSILCLDRQGLKDHGLLSVEAQFSIKKKDCVLHKDVWILRAPYNEQT